MTNCYLCQYSAVLRIRGADANSFVQGQFTNDVSVPFPAVRYGLWLNHKGRVQGDAHVLRVAAEEFLAISYFTGGTILKEHLESYIVADDVMVTDETRQWTGLAIWSGDCTPLARAAKLPVPPAGNVAGEDGWFAFRGRRSAGDTLELMLPVARGGEVQAKLLSAGAVAAATADAERERIRGAIPAVPIDIGPNDLPAEGGLDEVAVSFTKGCFLGQEVVARLRNLGQARRRLVAVTAARGALAAGAALFQGDVRVGEVRSAVADGEGSLALAMLTLLNWRQDLGFSLAPGGAAGVHLLRR